MQKLYLVIPCYNEEEVLPETSKQLRAKMETLMAAGKISKESRIVFANDGKKTGRGKLLSPCTRKIRCFKELSFPETRDIKTHCLQD